MNRNDPRYTWRRPSGPGSLTLVLLAALLAGALSPAEILAKRRKPRNAPRIVSPAERIVLDHITVFGDSLPQKARETLLRIPTTHRRLLALKIYMRRREEIPCNWAWSSREAADYRKTDEYRAAISDVAKVRQAFAEMNPGYELTVAIEIRSLESQLQKWNNVTSVGIAGGEMIDTCLALVGDSRVFGGAPTDSSLATFKRFLETFEPAMEPTVAVPGLSQHGQLRAFDFRVRRGRTLVAGTTAATIPDRWETPGWTERLKEAVFCASDRFAGPLASPYEPWHYAYTPLGGEPKEVPEEPEHRREPEIHIETGDAVTGTR